MKNIYPFLWFNNKAEQAMKFYVSTFKNAKVIDVSRDGDAVFSCTFKIGDIRFIAFNGGPHYKFSPATSFFVECETQKEVDRLWAKLSKGGKIMRCGWVTDKFGVTWQVIPKLLGDLLQKDESGRVMAAMMKMKKIDSKKLRQAYDSK